jgi:2-oxoglutarate dehydrogenase E2 component (dihydrolipoamide succinyltransferase)
MAIEIKVPSVGESITEGILSRWLKKDGEAVRTDEPLFELETDKATQEIPSPADGVLSISTREGSKVTIGSVVGSVDPQGKPRAKGDGKAVPTQRTEKTEKKEKTPVRAEAREEQTEALLSPAARQLAADRDVDIQELQGSGRDGRIIKEDVLNYLEEQEKAAPPKKREEKERTSPAPPVAPLTDRLAAAAAPPSVPSRVPGQRETRERMSAIRQRIATRLVEAQSNAAILTTFNEVDLSAVMALRAKYREAFQKKYGTPLGFMGFFVKACVAALETFPVVNARVDGNEIVYHHYHDIGVAVSTERGLMVPVVRDCDGKNFAEIEQTIAELAAKAREGRITPNDLQGGTFTITNGGVFGSLLSTPILNPPQSAILGMHTIQKRPVAIDDQVAIRPMMYVALSYDHRIIDGREAVRFLVRVKECVESPERLLLEI